MKVRYRTELGDFLEYLELQGPAAEVGVAEGRNAANLIKSPAITKLYLVDAWTKLPQVGDGGFPQEWHDNNFKEAQERVEEYKHKAYFLKGKSVDMIASIPDYSLVLAYVDGDHSYEGALADFKAIYNKVQSGGVIAGHDYLNPAYGVSRALNHFLASLDRLPIVHVIEEDHIDMAGFWFIKN